MTESEARTARISDVWEHFRYLVIDAIPHLNECISYYKGSKTHLSDYQKQLDGCNRDAITLRAVLLERCEDVFEQQLNVHESGFIVLKSVDGVYESQEAEDIGSAWLFMAWELKQRENELQKG